MSAFASGDLQVLVSTSVVEVGVDVANATRDGGRARRALRPGPAPPAAGTRRPRRCALRRACSSATARLSDEARARLEAMVATDDGFVIAERDLEIRGAGDFFGTRQWGMSGFRVARPGAGPRAPVDGPDRGVSLRGRRGAGEVADPILAGVPGRPAAGSAVSAWLGWADMGRIIGGSGKGRRLKSPRGNATRPTASRVRQALFDVLASEVPGCRFLDLFAGSGGVGLEACSRGAAGALLVEVDGAAARAIRAERGRARPRGRGPRCRVPDVRAALPRIAASGQRFGIVFLDPPYGSALYEPVLSAVAAGSILAQGGVVVAEHFHKRALPETIGRLSRTRVLRVGEQCLSFYRPAGADGE